MTPLTVPLLQHSGTRSMTDTLSSKTPAKVAEDKDALYDALLSLQTHAEMDAFLSDLCTPAEVRAFAERWAVARLLDQKSKSYREIAIEAGEIFLHNGGEAFSHIPCLNDSEGGMDVIETVVRRELRGWVG